MQRIDSSHSIWLFDTERMRFRRLPKGADLAAPSFEALRTAVMTADDVRALWAWVQCPSGRDDLPAWKRLLGELDFSDPRRSLAAARLGSLRATYAVS